jgi:hypothetical protein
MGRYPQSDPQFAPSLHLSFHFRPQFWVVHKICQTGDQFSKSEDQMNFKTGYKCFISLFSPSNVDIIDSYFHMSLLNVYYITLYKLHEKHLILNEVEIWQVCYLGVVTIVVAHYIANLPMTQCKLYRGYFRYLVAQMQELKTKIEILVSYRIHSSFMRTLVAEISLHMYTKKNLEMQTWHWFNSNFCSSTQWSIDHFYGHIEL